MPLAWMVWAIAANPAARGEFSMDEFRWNLLGRTIGYNAAAACIAAAMGVPAGFVLGRGRGMLARLLWVIIPAALILPSLSYAYGWSQFVRIIHPGLSWLEEHEFSTPAVGLIHLRAIAFHLPVHFNFRPGEGIDVFRCIWSLGSWLWAVPAGMVGLALRRLDTAVQQQALLDGALRRVTLRQLAGPIIASMAIVTVLATQEFAVYEPTGISVVATEVRMVFDTGAVSSADNPIAAVNPGTAAGGFKSPDQPARAAAAIATSAPLLLVTVVLAVIAALGATRSSASEALAVGDWPRRLDASRATVALTLFFVVLNIAAPIAALLVSLRNPDSIGDLIDTYWPNAAGALFVAACAAAAAIVVALSAGAKWIPGLLAIAAASFLIGGQLLAIALIRIYNRPGLVWAYDTAVVPIVAYVGRFGWLAIAAGRGTWSRPWRELRDMASVDGASVWRAALHVVWPLAWPALLAGGLVVGALSLTEVPATVLLMPQEPQVLTPTLMTWLHMSRYDAMIEASLLMMGMVLIPAIAAVILSGIGASVLRLNARRG